MQTAAHVPPCTSRAKRRVPRAQSVALKELQCSSMSSSFTSSPPPPIRSPEPLHKLMQHTPSLFSPRERCEQERSSMSSVSRRTGGGRACVHLAFPRVRTPMAKSGTNGISLIPSVRQIRPNMWTFPFCFLGRRGAAFLKRCTRNKLALLA